MNFSKAMKPGTFDVKPKEDFAAQTQAISQVFPLPRKSCVSASTSGLLAIGEGDKVSILSADELYNSDRFTDKCEALLRRRRHFEVFNVCFNPSDPSKLVVSGICDAHVFALSETAEVTNRIAIEGILRKTKSLAYCYLLNGFQDVQELWSCALETMQNSTIAEVRTRWLTRTPQQHQLRHQLDETLWIVLSLKLMVRMKS